MRRQLHPAFVAFVVLAACGSSSGAGAKSAGDDDSGTAVPDPGASFTSCLTFCPSPNAGVSFSCYAPVTSVQTSGPCTSSGPACVAKISPCLATGVLIMPTQAGSCHVDATLTDGSHLSTDLTFEQMPASQCCAAVVAPSASSAMVTVAVPSSECVVPPWEQDGGADAAPEGGASGDAQSEAGDSAAGDAISDAPVGTGDGASE